MTDPWEHPAADPWIRHEPPTRLAHRDGCARVVVATDAPLLPDQCRARSRAVPAGTTETLEHLSWGAIDPFYAAVVEAVEEAAVNALVAARDMEGRDGHVSYALPHDEIRAAFAG